MVSNKPNTGIKGLNELRDEIHKNACEKGFYEGKTDLGTKLMLTVSELAECLEADRKGKYANMDFFESQKELSFNAAFEDNIKDTVPDELADTIIRVLDICGYIGIDINKHVELKMKYNSGRERLHGKKY